MTTEKDTIRALKEKISEYETLLKEVFEKTRLIGKVVAGPHQEGENSFYRVRVGGSEVYLVSATREKIPAETEVLVNETCIYRVLPSVLEKKTQKKEFKRMAWENIGGLKSQLQEIRRQVEMHSKHSSLTKEFGIEPSKGILLYGPPGCGKTLISRVIASSFLSNKKATEDHFVYIKGPEILNSYVGATEARIREIFSGCRELTRKTGLRCIVFIDEAESLLSRRGSGISSDVNNTIVPQFLSEMDGFEEDSPFVLLSTNLPHSLDPAVVREGRIDLKVEIKRPTIEDSTEIFQIHLKNLKVAECETSLSKMASEKLFSNSIENKISGSLIKTLCNLSAREALFRYTEHGGKKGITQEDMENAIQKTISSQI